MTETTAPAPAPGPALTARNVLTTDAGHLALTLLGIELLAGIQTFLSSTVTPLIAAELHGQRLYGVVSTAALIATFVTIPLAGPLMKRYSPALLLTVLTPVSVLAGIAGALSQSMEFYAATRVVAGLVGGALSGVSMGAIATGLPPDWRRLVLAANNAMWVLSALAGPAYAAWAAAALGWRWAMVLYLPFLVLARWVVARKLPHHPTDPAKQPLPLGWALTLAAGIALLTALSIGSAWRWPLGALGLVLVGFALVRLLPRGVATLRAGGRAGIAAAALVTMGYAGVDSLVAIAAHDTLGFDAPHIGWALTMGALCWSLVGLAAARWPVTGRAFLARGIVAAALLGIGIGLMAWSLAAHAGWAWYVGMIINGVGIGAIYLDAMNVAFTPDADDPLSATDAAAGLVLAEQVAWAVPLAVATSLFAAMPALGPVIVAALAAPIPFLALAVVRASRQVAAAA